MKEEKLNVDSLFPTTEGEGGVTLGGANRGREGRRERVDDGWLAGCLEEEEWERWWEGRRWVWNRAVKKNCEPTPGSLSTQMSPPIIWMRLQGARE